MKIIYRLRVDILRVKQLKKLKLKKEFKIITRFAKKYIGKYYKTVIK